MFALSTAWNADRLSDGIEIAEEIHGLGIEQIELNFSLTEQMVKDIAQFSLQKNISIVSLHNYCPIPKEKKREEAMPDCYSLSSLDEDERKKAIHYTKATISTAKKLNARAVVLHSGRVEIQDKTRNLIDLARLGKKNSQEYKEIFSSFVRERKAKSEKYFVQILKSLEALSVYAQDSGILLGIENRYYYREIPSLEECGIIMEKFKGRNVCYWHDVGHAFILEQLGFMQENDWLNNYGKYIGGIHMHNVKNLIDHHAPFEGDFDFSLLEPFVNPQTIKVLEVHSQVKSEGVTRSMEFLKGCFA
jgi:sugar phosphate isomerase/epimerase